MLATLPRIIGYQNTRETYTIVVRGRVRPGIGLRRGVMTISVGIGVLLVIGLAGVSATVRGLLHWSKTISTHPQAPR